MATIFKILIFLSIVNIWLYANSNIKLNITTENYPPFNFIDDNNTLQGISVEILELILKRMDLNITKKDIKLLPWARAYKQTLNDKNGMVFSVMRTWQREKEFKWVGPISIKTVVLLANKGSKIKLYSLKDAKDYKIGVILNDIGEILLRDRGLNLDRVSGVNALNILIKKLKTKKIDLLAYSYQSDVHHDDILDTFKVVYKLKEDGLYFAFNKNISDDLIKKFQENLNELQKEPIYKKIFSKYLDY